MRTEGFVVEGAASWQGELPAGGRHEQRFVLRPTSTGVATVTIDHAIVGVLKGEPVLLRFRVDGDDVRPCAASDCE